MKYFIRVLGVISKEKIKELSFIGIDENKMANLVGLFCDYSEFDIVLNHNFNFLIAPNHLKKIKVDTVVRYVFRSPKIPFEYIPIGHKTLVFVEAENINVFDGILPVVDGWVYNSDKVFLSDVSEIYNLNEGGGS